MLGEKIAHGTPFRRAFEEGCLDGNKVIQIGLRGSNYNLTDYDWGKSQVNLKILIVDHFHDFRNVKSYFSNRYNIVRF